MQNLLIYFLKLSLLEVVNIGRTNCLNITEFKVPREVQPGERVQLVCIYDLQGDSLYTLKWYREEKEFFRLEPKANPTKQFFNVTGINVDEESSNETSVILNDVNNLTAGLFVCEISAESTFQTVNKEQVMLVKQSSNAGSSLVSSHFLSLKYFLPLILFYSICQNSLLHQQ